MAELVGTHRHRTIQSGVTRRVARSPQDELREPNLPAKTYNAELNEMKTALQAP